MRNQRQKTRLADMAATGFASLILAINLMVRDPEPAAAAVTASAQSHGDPALIITLIFMALGLCVVAYGLYHERHAVKAGLTGWAQVNYPYGASLDDARSKLSYDLYYVKNFNLLLDFRIMLQTLRVVMWAGADAR